MFPALKLDLPHPIILASASPRRSELFKTLVSEFEIKVPNIDEESLISDDPIRTAMCTAEAKADAISRLYPSHIVVAGDTVVAIETNNRFELLGKPLDEADAMRMLSLLSGRQHIVVTGISIAAPDFHRTDFAKSTVWFRDLQPEEMSEYVATGEPMDKAGGYAIQGGAAEFVDKIEGSSTNIIGLPMEKLEEILRLIR